MNVPSPPWIEITTILPCSVGCYYCPQSVIKNAYKGERILSLDTFKVVLKNVPRDVLIDFAGFAEPFLNPACADMMLYAHAEGYRIAVNSTLTGMSDEDAKRIEVIPFEFFFYHDVRLECKEYPFIHYSGRVSSPLSRAGNLYKTARCNEKGYCERSPDHKINVMLPNGDVVLCCNDYGLTHPLGNLLTDNYYDLKRRGDFELCRFCEDYKTEA